MTGRTIALDQIRRQAVVMIGAVGLNMSMVHIEAEVGLAGHGGVIPARGSITFPEFCGKGIERHAVQGNTEILHTESGRARSLAGIDRHTKMIILGADGIGIMSVWKTAGGVIGNAVGQNNAIGPLGLDLDVIDRRQGPCHGDD